MEKWFVGNDRDRDKNRFPGRYPDEDRYGGGMPGGTMGSGGSGGGPSRYPGDRYPMNGYRPDGQSGYG